MPTVNRPFAQRARRRGASPNNLDLSRDIPHDYRRVVGAWLRDLRLKAGMTQAQLADILGVGFTAISAIEVGRGSVPPERYDALASALGVDRAEFGKTMLRYSNPWAFEMIYGDAMSRSERARLKEELAQMPTRVGNGSGPRISD